MMSPGAPWAVLIGMLCSTTSPWKRSSRSPISERTRPGAMQFTRTPAWATSFASTLVRAFTPALATWYGAPPGAVMSAPTDEMKRNTPRCAVTCGIAALAKPGARIHALLSIEDRDASSGLTAAEIAANPRRSYDFAVAGLALERVDVATPGVIAASGSSWAKRLGQQRVVYALELRRLHDRTGDRD